MSSHYRLIWFQHLSKAAGSSIIEMAALNGETFYPQHTNGNPRGNDGKLIRLWEMDAAALSAFVDHCEQTGVTFVATEWGAPDIETLAADPRVKLITCMRDPLARFMSNFYYAYYGGATACDSPAAYADSVDSIWGIYTRSNYYCRIFSRHHERPEPVGQQQFEQARRNLALFDCCALLKEQDAFSRIKAVAGWSAEYVHVNRTGMSISLLLKHLAKGNFGLLWRHITHPRKDASNAFAARFAQENRWDYRLLSECASEYLSDTEPVAVEGGCP